MLLPVGMGDDFGSGDGIPACLPVSPLLCASPDTGGAWSSVGCSIVTSYPESTACFCNHTTNFAVLLQVYEVQVSNPGPAKGLAAPRRHGRENVQLFIALQAAPVLFPVLGAEEHRGGVDAEDPDVYWLRSVLLCPDRDVRFIPGSRVRRLCVCAWGLCA